MYFPRIAAFSAILSRTNKRLQYYIIHMDKTQIISNYISASGWLEQLRCPQICSISFLAAGEYNENWLITAKDIASPQKTRTFVFRINHGSQLALQKKQISYEFSVLTALKNSTVTPVPYFVDPEAEQFSSEFDNGVLLMEFIKGSPLDYTKDLEQAAAIFAAIHSQPVPPEHNFICQKNPVTDIVTESHSLLSRFSSHPKTDIRNRLEQYACTISALSKEYASAFNAEKQLIVNTEVNSGNFIINHSENKAHLVDWEKAVISCRYQDLGHFIVPTTTLWKTNYVATDEHREFFLSRYKEYANLSQPLEELAILTGILEKTIILRGLSWCYMAWFEYTKQDRLLKNNDTFETIQRYLDNIEWFLQ